MHVSHLWKYGMGKSSVEKEQNFRPTATRDDVRGGRRPESSDDLPTARGQSSQVLSFSSVLRPQKEWLTFFLPNKSYGKSTIN